MQQMGGRVIGPDRRAARVIDRELERDPGADFAFLDDAFMHEEVAELLLRIGDAKAHAGGAHDAGVADLTAGLAIKRRLIENDRSRSRRAEPIGRASVPDDRRDDAFRPLRLIAEKIGRPGLFPDREPDVFGRRLAGSGPGPARIGALALHGGVEPRDIDAERTQRAARPASDREESHKCHRA